jgi:deoxyribodipyrimidine photo-lyase
MRELIWREFFAHVLYGFPQVLDGSYIEKYRRIKWRNSSHFFERWKRGMTGFPIVDASMRQLNATGYMHNRGRMVVATFLTKTLLLNWRLGEMYFAHQLTDYDPASNNGNWQSIASTGVDGKPYFRDMNPWIQSAKFDADAEFIKKWVPELREVLPKDIHHWDSKFADYKGKVGGYPGPMVDYSEQKLAMIRLYREA